MDIIFGITLILIVILFTLIVLFGLYEYKRDDYVFIDDEGRKYGKIIFKR